MQGKKEYTEKLFLNFQLSDKVPEDNFYRQLKNLLDLEWLRKATLKYYGREGQVSIFDDALNARDLRLVARSTRLERRVERRARQCGFGQLPFKQGELCMLARSKFAAERSSDQHAVTSDNRGDLRRDLARLVLAVARERHCALHEATIVIACRHTRIV